MAKWFDDVSRQSLLAFVPTWIAPTHLTYARAALVVPVVLLRHTPVWAVALLILSSLCDILDGALARARNETSDYGAWIDPWCDKIFVFGTLFFACGDRVPAEIQFAIIGLDLLLTEVRDIKAQYGLPTSSNRAGGLKTWLQSFAMAFVLTSAPGLVALALPTFILAIFAALASIALHLRDFRIALAT